MSKAPQIDLNITVPYIFSARLYPYGTSKGDQALARDSQLVRLHDSVRFIRKTYDSITVGMNVTTYAHSDDADTSRWISGANLNVRCKTIAATGILPGHSAILGPITWWDRLLSRKQWYSGRIFH